MFLSQSLCAEADEFFEQELQRWKKVIDTAGIKLER